MCSNADYSSGTGVLALGDADEQREPEVTPPSDLLTSYLAKAILPMFLRWQAEGEPDRRT